MSNLLNYQKTNNRNMATPNDTYSRRNRMDLMSPEEKAIQNIIWEVEKLGADTRLTDVVILLGKAKDTLSDFIDGK